MEGWKCGKGGEGWEAFSFLPGAINPQPGEPIHLLHKLKEILIRKLAEKAGWSKWPTRQAHDLKTAGSNPAPALHVVSSKRRFSYNNPCGK